MFQAQFDVNELPDRKTTITLVTTFLRKGSLAEDVYDLGPPRTTDDNVEKVQFQQQFQIFPTQQLGIKRSTVMRTLHDNLIYFHINLNTQLNFINHLDRACFCC